MINNSISGSRDSKLEVIVAITLIILVTIVAYGLMLKSFGYYSDEWYIAWAGRTSGPDMIIDLHQFAANQTGVLYIYQMRVTGRPYFKFLRVALPPARVVSYFNPLISIKFLKPASTLVYSECAPRAIGGIRQ